MDSPDEFLTSEEYETNMISEIALIRLIETQYKRTTKMIKNLRSTIRK
jgi:hypothetical protein